MERLSFDGALKRWEQRSSLNLQVEFLKKKKNFFLYVYIKNLNSKLNKILR